MDIYLSGLPMVYDSSALYGFESGGMYDLKAKTPAGENLALKSDKPLVINNWFNGGNYAYSGLRPLSGGVGAFNSLHRYGAAVDIKCAGGEATYLLVAAAIKCGFKRIGISRKSNFVHVGIGYPGAPDTTIWTY